VSDEPLGAQTTAPAGRAPSLADKVRHSVCKWQGKATPSPRRRRRATLRPFAPLTDRIP